MKKYWAVLLFLFLVSLPVNAQASMDANFLDVGQGDSTVIQSEGHTLVIDLGPSEAQPVLESTLSRLGVGTIDMLILSHPHADHDSNLGWLISNYKINELWMPEYSDDEEDYGDLLRKATGNGTKISYPCVGDSIAIGDATVTILSAEDPTSFPDDKNLWSLVTMVACGNTKILVMGDAEDINEFKMIDYGLNLDADILRVGHHGSRTSTSGAFLDAVTPDVAVISCGINNSYGHPHQETLDALWERGIVTYRTDITGTIMVTIAAAGYRAKAEN